MNGIELAVSLLGTLLSGGLIGVWLKYRLEDRKLTAEEREDLAERRRSDLDRALEVVTQQRDDALSLVKDFRNELDQMRLEVQGLRFARDLDPFPNWVIGLDGRYLYVNREFEKQFLEPAGNDYRFIVGKSHEALWPDPFCKTLRNLDDLARRVPDGRARATTVLKLGSDERQLTVHKFPIRVRGAVIGFAGYITDIERSEEKIL
jgi:PAS domain-containing protein